MLFPWYQKYPYQNDEVLNLDWILSTIDNLVKEVSEFVTLNTIKYADPIQWNITHQYEKNTVVVEPLSGTAYISTKAVPAGVGINNTDYWSVVFTLDVVSANKNITLRDDANNMLATFESQIGDWVLWNGTLYVATKAIEIGQAYTVDYNIERATVESFIKLYISNLKDYTDDLIDTIVGSLSDLTTENKDSVVNAINELVSTLSDVIDSIGTLSNLNTTAKDNIVNSINEVISNVGTLSNLNTSNKSNIVSAVNEVNSNVGTLFNLNTTNKSSTVAAINEVVKHISDLTGVRRVIIGDSYNVASVVTPTFGSLINDYLGNCINFGYGARGFAAATTFYESFSADLGSISDKENIKEVIVCAGANDVGQTFATLKSAISNFNTLIKTNFANAVLKIGFVGWSRYANDNWNETFRYYKKACDELGICYLNGVEIPLHNTQYLQTGGDSHHPNANGSAALAIAIVNALLSGDAAVDMLQRVTITQSGTHLIPAVAQYLYTGVKNGILSVNCKGIIYGNNGGSEAGVTALPVDTWVTIGTVEDSFLCVLDLENKARTIHALTGLLYDNKTKFAPIEFLIYGGGVVAIKNVSGAAITAAIGGEILPFSVSMPVTD